MLDYREVSAEQVRVVESDEAQRAGCPMEHKNMLVHEPFGRPPERVDPRVFGALPVSRCDYTSDPDDPEVGAFTAGGPITPAELSALIDAAVRAATADQTGCATAASHFSVLGNSTTPALYVETDGCHRLLRQG